MGMESELSGFDSNGMKCFLGISTRAFKVISGSARSLEEWKDFQLFN